MFKNIGILNLQQQKNRETTLCQNQTIILQTIILQRFSQKIY